MRDLEPNVNDLPEISMEDQNGVDLSVVQLILENVFHLL